MSKSSKNLENHAVGTVHTNNMGLEYTVINHVEGHSALNRNITVQFTASGSVRVVDVHNACKGKLLDMYHRGRYGVGYTGDFDKAAHPYWKRARSLWSNMLKRCYSTKDKKGYTGVVVDKRWQCFALFLEDMSQLQNFDKWLSYSGYELDKEMRGNGCVYSKHTCMFVKQEINRRFTGGGTGVVYAPYKHPYPNSALRSRDKRRRKLTRIAKINRTRY